MRTPAWLSPSHPIVHRELGQWRRHSRQLWLMFVVMPLGLSACLWLPYVVRPFAASGASIVPGLFLTAWLWEAVLSLWLGFVATTRAITLVTRERESGNWPLLRLTLFNVADILRAKMGAILYWLRWPIALVMALRLAALAATFAANLSDPSPGLALLTVLLAGLFSLELVISVVYNGLVGLLASSLTRTTAAANGIAYIVHAGLFVLIFGPLWYLGASGFASSLFLPIPYGVRLLESMIAALSLLLVLSTAQGVLIALMSLAAASRAEHITD